MINRDIYVKDPLKNRLANNGVAEVKDDLSQQALDVLRYELETFVCDGEYEKGLEKMLGTYLRHLNDDQEQPGVWISGFYGSGKSHLAKMLRTLWNDFTFSDGTSARDIAELPQEIADHLKELTTQGRRHGGLHAASGTLGAGANNKVRLALLGIVFKSAGLPEQYHLGRFVLWLKSEGHYEQVKAAVESAGKEWLSELNHLFMSPHIAKALLKAQPDLAANERELHQLLRAEYKKAEDVSNEEMVTAITEALSNDGKFPLTLVVLDEVQAYIDSTGDAYQVQEAVESCCKHFGGKLLFVGTGQNALSGMPNLMKLMGRFQVLVQLSDADVESVIRKIILQKKASAKAEVEKVLQNNLGEISRHLRGTKIEFNKDDEQVMVADYPVLPVRRRFWEKVLRIVDTTGTVSQLRNQLRVIHEAAQDTADLPLGHVVSGDFIYKQIAPNLLQTGVISKEVFENIGELDAGDADQKLKGRLLALIFLIGKLPTNDISDSGVRATANMLADLLVEDLKGGSAGLRKQVPDLLEQLASQGTVMAMDTPSGVEYRLQTQESSQWHDTFRQQEAELAGNTQRIENEREDLFHKLVRSEVNKINMVQGASKEPRQITVTFDAVLPKDANKRIYVWVQDGWSADEKSVLAEARNAGPELPTLYAYIPARNRSELSKTIITRKAADATLQIRGTPSTPEGKDARAAMETRVRDAEKQQNVLIKEIFEGVRVFQAGGNELDDNTLAEKLGTGAKASLVRLYREFDSADHANWGKVVERARKDGGQNALEVIGHKADPEQHPVCAAVLKYIGSGKKGAEIREYFKEAPYGWPQDAIDGALYALLATGSIRALDAAHKAVDAKGLERNKLTQASFKVENVTLKPVQRIQVRKLIAECGIQINPGEEDIKAAVLVQLLRDLAGTAGGSAPLPDKPDTALIDEIASEVGNAQLVKLYDHRDAIRDIYTSWKATAEKITQRHPGWSTLTTLITLSRGMAFHDDLAAEQQAIYDHRRLLDDPDPVQPLVNQAMDKLRTALQHHHKNYVTAA